MRNGPRVERAVFDSLAASLDALEERMDALAPQARRQAIEVFKRRFDAVRQVAVRGEIAGPGGCSPESVAASTCEATARRRPTRVTGAGTQVELRPGETAYAGLRRALHGGGD